MNLLIGLCLVFVFIFRVSEQQNFPSLYHDKGNIAGTWKRLGNGKSLEAYEGIPYAMRPVDGLRFEPPVKYTDWPVPGITILAKQPSQVCLQYDELKQVFRGSEDCLYLNVYRPEGNWQNHHLLPVIFYIHGDDFQSGSGAEHGPQYLVEKDVIVVTINYRLGPLGFLSTADDVVPGNMGLKDQAVALQWVNSNIIIFGGDKDKVAIFGHGAGGASVHYHYLSKQSRGTFRKGMSLSGTALAPWALMEDSAKKAKALGCVLRCKTNNNYEMIQCLRKESAVYIMQTALKFRRYQKTPFASFGPVVEHKDGAFTFISKYPSEIIAAGEAQKSPWVAGFVYAEGLGVAAGMIDNEELLDKMERNWASAGPILLDYRDVVDKSKQSNISNLIKEHYFGKSPFRTKLTKFVDMIGDRMFANNVALATVLHADRTTAPTRLYKFSYKGARSFGDISAHIKEFGPAHGDDLAYVFDLPVNMSTTSKDRKMREFMLNFWVSYARDPFSQPDVPGLDWGPMRKKQETISYVHILGPDSVKLESFNNIGDRFFWRSLKLNERHYPNYNRRSSNGNYGEVNRTTRRRN